MYLSVGSVDSQGVKKSGVEKTEKRQNVLLLLSLFLLQKIGERMRQKRIDNIEYRYYNKGRKNIDTRYEELIRHKNQRGNKKALSAI